MKKFLLLLVLSLPITLFSQVEDDFDADFENMMQVLDDEITFQEEGLFSLRFSDAENDDPVKDATITINGVGTYTTDAQGLVRFPKQKDGKYNFTFKKDGYIAADFTFEIVAEMIYFNRFSVSKLMDLGQIRIVLDWSSSPKDLDIHLEKAGEYHIAYHHMRVSNDRTARLDRDDMDGQGPETITITDVDENASYNCYVHDYSNRNNTSSKKLSKSKGRISVYHNNRLEFTLDVPTEKEGTRWDTFQLNNGMFSKLNTIAN